MKLFLKTKDFSISKEPFELYHDATLDMLITKPQPEDLAKYYESETYISHTDSSNTMLEKCYQRVKKYSLNKKVSLINNFVNRKKTLLDVGAGTGDFLLVAKSKGWKTSGTEPNPYARDKAGQKGLELQKDMDAFSAESYEVITLWHVLEHIPDLEEQIQSILNVLDPKGTLVIAVPNFNSYDAKHYKEYWAAYDVPRHLWHFSKTAITRIFEKHQWNVVATKPMWFDSFYVSLLSEKYKYGKQRPIHAFLVGLWSNLSALFTKECSSHIYVLKKGLEP